MFSNRTRHMFLAGMIALLMFALAYSFTRLSGRSSHSSGTPYVVVISMDGFRYDYLGRYATPCLDSLGREGVAGRMQPSYPSKTFPNHYTICTGLVPDHHGIIANSFPDRENDRFFSIRDEAAKFDGSYYGGEPLWCTAQLQGLKAGIVYWPGSDTEICGMRPNYWHPYDSHLLTFDERIDEVERYLTLPYSQRPRLVMCYFNEPDHQGHKHGPDAMETQLATQRVDSCVGALYHRLMQLDISDSIDVIILSDHGMAQCGPERFIRLLDYVPERWITRGDYSVPTHLDAAPGCLDSLYAALKDVPHMRVWCRGEVPAYLQAGDNPRNGDLILDPELAWNIGLDHFSGDTGQHGFDPRYPEMQVPFWAIGPDFQSHYRKDSLFANTAIYPLVCHLLHIEPATGIDGRLEEIEDVLR